MWIIIGSVDNQDNSVHNILELCNVLVQVPAATSETKHDI